MVHLPGALPPGVGVGFGFAVAVGPPIHKTRANKVPAETTSIEPLIRRNNCDPFETISNFFIKALLLRWEQVSYQRDAAVNRNPRGFMPLPRSTFEQRATGIEPAWPAWKAGTLPLSYARADNASPARTKLPRARATAKRFLPRLLYSELFLICTSSTLSPVFPSTVKILPTPGA